MQLGNIDFSDKEALVRKVLYFFPIFVLVNLVIVYLFTDISDLVKIGEFNPGYLLLAAGIRLIPWFSKAIRLETWMRFLGHKFTYREGVRISVWSELGAAITPTSIGGQPIKMGMLYNRGITAGEAASLGTISFVEDVAAHAVGLPLVIVTSFLLNLHFLEKIYSVLESKAMAFSAGIVAVIILVLLWRLLIIKTGSHPGKLRVKVLRFWIDFKALYASTIRRGKIRFLVNVLLTMLQWTARYSITAVLAFGLGFEINVFAFIIIQMLIFALMSLVPTPGASGGAEGLFLLFFSQMIPASSIGTILIGWRILDFYFMTLLSLAIIGIESIFHRNQNSSEKVI